MAAPTKNYKDDYFSPISPSVRAPDTPRSRSYRRLNESMMAPPRTPRPTPAGRMRIPPPIPSRTRSQDYRPLPMYGSSGYGSYGGYSGYGSSRSMFPPGVPSMYNRHHVHSDFVRLAEDSSRPAFESMENIVDAFGSIAMVLESTYIAVQSSFRAVLGLAEHFSRLRVQMGQMMSTYTLFRTLRYLYRKLLYLLRLSSHQSNQNEDLWNELANATGPFSAQSNKNGKQAQKSSWPLLLFFCIVIGGPYLIWRLMANITDSAGGDWMTGEGDHYVGVAEYDYDAENDDELSFNAGQEVRIAPKDVQPRIKGWLLACADGEKSGLVPANYIAVRGKRHGTNSAQTKPVATLNGDSGKSVNYPTVWKSVTSENCDIQNTDAESTEFVNALKDNTQSFSDTDRNEFTPPPSRPFETESSESEARLTPVPSPDSGITGESSGAAGLDPDKTDQLTPT